MISSAAIWCGKWCLSWPKVENCVQTHLGKITTGVKGVAANDKPFLTLCWKSRAERCIFDLNYLLPNANFKRKMVINLYIRCLFGQKKVIVEILRLSCSCCLTSKNFSRIFEPFLTLSIFLCGFFEAVSRAIIINTKHLYGAIQRTERLTLTKGGQHKNKNKTKPTTSK